MTLVKSHTLMKNHERLRNVSCKSMRVYRKNEQNQLILSGNLPQGRAIKNGCSHKVESLKQS